MTLLQQLAENCRLMLEYSFEQGKTLPDDVESLIPKLESASSDDLVDMTDTLVRAHEALSRIVAPATPQSIASTGKGNGVIDTLRSVPFVSSMVCVGLICLIGFVLTIPFAASEPGSGRLDLGLLNLFFAAGLGAAFYALFTAYHYLVRRTFDSRYTLVYWTRFALGLLSGVILANLIDAQKVAQGASVLRQIGPGLLALIGGYAADAVNALLKRIVGMLMFLVKGETENAIETIRTETAMARTVRDFQQQINEINNTLRLYESLNGDEPEIREMREKLRTQLHTLISPRRDSL